MKLTLLLTCITALQLTASVYSQNVKINVPATSGNFGDIIRAIEEQSEFKVFYKNEQVDLKRQVLISSSQVPLSHLLEQALKGTDISFTVLDKIIVLSPKDNLESFQQEVIKGRVVDESGASMPGVNVVEKGTTSGTITDMDGNFSLSVTSRQAVLVFSFVGYDTKEIPVGNETSITVSLIPILTSLEEVVVVGYGVQKKKLVTGATTQVKGDALEKLSTTTALQALQGQTAGVNITSTSGQPGEGFKVTIRGLGTIGNAGPLYIVDGVQTGDIKYLNNADIESIDVLKDAASAAIYGSRAANGVVLITTKQGKAGKAQITFDAYYGLQNRAKKISMLNAEEYAMIMNEQHLNSGGNVSALPFDLENLPEYTSAGAANTDWLDEMFVKNAVTQNYSLGANGGNESSIYSMSVSYTGQEGIVGGRSQSNYDRYGARFNSEKFLYNNKLKIGQHLTFTHTETKGISVGNQYSNSLRGAFNTSPLMPVYDDEGEFFNSYSPDITDQFGELYWNNKEVNPYASMVINNQSKRNFQKLVGDIYAEIKLLKNLTFRSTFGIEYYAEESRSFTPIYTLSFYSFSDYTRATQSMARSLSMNIDNILSYTKAFGNHNIEAMAGMAARQYKGSFIYGENTSLAFTDYEHAWLSNTTNEEAALKKVSGAPYDDDNLLSYFGRIQYGFRETYLFNATFRADGSSKFAEGNKWGYFPSVSAGWVMTNENFLKGNTFMDFLKLRASWGQNGNQNIEAFQYLAPIAFTQAAYAFGNTEGVNIPGSYPKRLSNEKVKWETSEQINVGIDSRFLSNKISFTADWYQKSTIDWLITAPILATAGTNAPVINGGKVINSGFEMNLSYSNSKDYFNYTVALNGAYNKNKVEEIPTNDGIIHGASNTLYANSTEFYRAQSGYPIGYFWGYKTDGLFQETADVTNYRSSSGKIIQPTAKPGDVRYKDLNDDGVIDEKDKTDLGNPNPDFTFGLSFSINYKALDFSLLTNGVAGNQIVQSYRDHTGANSNYTTAILDRWTGAGTSNKIPRVTNANINYQFSDLFIQNGDYLRISNVTLGYDVAKVVKLKNLSQCRIYASVQNLYTFTGYDGMDPEVGYGFDNGATDRFSSGIDLGYYPRPRTILVGVSLKF